MKLPDSNDPGNLTVTIRPGHDLHIGEDIIIQIPDYDHKGNPNRSIRIRVIAPKDISIQRRIRDEGTIL